MIFTAPTAATSPQHGFAEQEELGAILATGRQLQGTRALLEAMEDTLSVLMELLQEAGGVLAVLAVAEGGATKPQAQLRRYETLRRQGLGLLTALWHQDRGLSHVAGPSEAGIGGPGAMLRGVPALLMGLDPMQPGVAGAALHPDGRFAQALRIVAEARDGVDADCRSTIARISRNQEKLTQWEDEVGLGAFEDADLSREAVLLCALEVRQQLAGRAIGLLNQAPRCLLDIPDADAD